MRYLGNKISMIEIIDELIKEKIDFCGKKLTLFDAFSGTATVGDHFSQDFNIIANDIYYYSYVFSRGRLNNKGLEFKKLGFCPFEFFNNPNLKTINNGFIYNNYAPEKSERMYFSDENAMLIDTIRTTIQEWKKDQLINDSEYYYLLASLLESVSKVANIAGVYGAFLKKWDSRAIKRMQFIEVDYINKNKGAKVYNSDIKEIIETIDHDILYLDPPYTKNQYSSQYHILETIARYDNPEITGVTGTRKGKIGSTWSKEIQAGIELEFVIKNSRAKYILMSYSSLGIMSKTFIESLLKRYSKKGDVTTYEIEYKKYTNSRTNVKTQNYEYLFFIEKNDTDSIVYTSPLNYMGSKEKMITTLKQHMPPKINTFYDLFGGGFNVGININSNEVVYNDYNFKVRELIEMFNLEDTTKLIKDIKKIIGKYQLEKNNKENFVKARLEYNHPEPPLRSPIHLYTLILYGFQQQIRFNSKYDFNNPVGQSGYNENVEEKMISFSSRLKEMNLRFHSDDFEEFTTFTEDDFVYIDPPYLITLGSYNDGKRGFNGWSVDEEVRLLNYLTNLNEMKVKFMLSNVFVHKGKENKVLTKWTKENNFKVIECGKFSGREEIIIINY